MQTAAPPAELALQITPVEEHRKRIEAATQLYRAGEITVDELRACEAEAARLYHEERAARYGWP